MDTTERRRGAKYMEGYLEIKKSSQVTDCTQLGIGLINPSRNDLVRRKTERVCWQDKNHLTASLM